MKRIRAWILRVTGLFTGTGRAQEFSNELESHLQMHIEDNIRAGMTAEQARREALLKLGGVDLTKLAIDPDLGTIRESSMSRRINDSQTVYLHRSSAWLAGGFAALADSWDGRALWSYRLFRGPQNP